MSKRRNKSRFTKTDVNAICELQRKVDAYEAYIMCLAWYTSPRYETKMFALCVFGTDMDEQVGQAWENIERMRKELAELRAKDEMNKIPKMENNEDK